MRLNVINFLAVCCRSFLVNFIGFLFDTFGFNRFKRLKLREDWSVPVPNTNFGRILCIKNPTWKLLAWWINCLNFLIRPINRS